MYEATIEHPAITSRRYTCEDESDLLVLVHAVHYVQGHKVPSKSFRPAVTAVQHQADTGGAGEISALAFTVTVRPFEADCEGHESLAGADMGRSVLCDGSCVPRRRFGPNELVDLVSALDDAELDAAGGCGACGLEPWAMCVGCGRCNCERHDACVRPVDVR